MKIIMLKGLPSSGKTSWANEQLKKGSYIRISKDDIRPMLGGFSQRKEKEVLRIRNLLIEFGVKQKHNVIVDDTNLNPTHEKTLRQLAESLGAKFEVNDSFLDVSPEECIKRDLHRGDKAVGAEVIWDMYYKWLAPKPNRLLDHEFGLPRCVLVDIDGTLALNTSQRSFYDLTKVDKDTPDPFISCVVDALGSYGVELNGHKYPYVFLVSEREDSCREMTEAWLDKNFIPYDKLFMRKADDARADEIVKQEIYEENIKGKFTVLGVIDDRPKVCRKWRELGLRVAQVGNPYVEF